MKTGAPLMPAIDRPRGGQYEARMFILILSLLSALTAEAKLTTLCELKMSKDEKQVLESVELPVELKPFERNEYVSRAAFTSRLLPGFRFVVTVIESLDEGDLRWHTQAFLMREANGNIVARGNRVLDYNAGGTEYELVCGSFDKTEAKALPAPAADERETLRRKVLGGAPSVRAYSEKNPENDFGFSIAKADLYDLYLQVLADPSPHSAILRESMAALARQGMHAQFLSRDNTDDNAGSLISSDSKCTVGGREYTCDIEEVRLEIELVGERTVENGSKETWGLQAVVYVHVFRDSKSRLILGYAVKSFNVSIPERGGNSSTSGGIVR